MEVTTLGQLRFLLDCSWLYAAADVPKVITLFFTTIMAYVDYREPVGEVVVVSVR